MWLGRRHVGRSLSANRLELCHGLGRHGVLCDWEAHHEGRGCLRHTRWWWILLLLGGLWHARGLRILIQLDSDIWWHRGRAELKPSLECVVSVLVSAVQDLVVALVLRPPEVVVELVGNIGYLGEVGPGDLDVVPGFAVELGNGHGGLEGVPDLSAIPDGLVLGMVLLHEP